MGCGRTGSAPLARAGASKRVGRRVFRLLDGCKLPLGPLPHLAVGGDGGPGCEKITRSKQLFQAHPTHQRHLHPHSITTCLRRSCVLSHTYNCTHKPPLHRPGARTLVWCSVVSSLSRCARSSRDQPLSSSSVFSTCTRRPSPAKIGPSPINWFPSPTKKTRFEEGGKGVRVPGRGRVKL